jgi:Amidohydrolase family
MRDAVAGVVAALCLSLSPAFAQSGQLAITHVTVIDPRDGSKQPDATVLIKGARIARVGRHVRAPRGARVIDASGKYVIPGLWDMHVHIGSVESAKVVFPALIAKGITGVRDMGTPLKEAIEIRAAAKQGGLPGLEVFVAGPLLNGPLPFKTPLILSVGTPEEARRAVDQLHAAGVDFVKVHDALPAPEYDAIASECRKIGMPFAGHVPPSVTAEHASEAGQRSIEHLGGRFYGVLLACSRDEAAITNRIREVVSSVLASMTAGKEADDSVIFRAEMTRPLVEGFDPDKASRLIARFRRNGTWQCPTLVSLPLRSALADRTDLSDEDRSWGQRLLEKIDSVVVQLAKQNADLLAGTDAPLATPRLHEELDLLVAGGMTPLQALQTTTLNPARFFGRTGDFGSVSRGRVADLVVLDANPLEDIRNTRRVSGVLIRGVYLDPNASHSSSSARVGVEAKQTSHIVLRRARFASRLAIRLKHRRPG